ncbi:MAG: sulfatase-like hydrolase/transferase, partial [Planctomycetes bacterium]|nr:sulfatase-like hydrolase/transferase [Planctomycetota bacterium]
MRLRNPVCVTLFVLFLGLSSVTQAQTRPPNIIVILADDLGWTEINCRDVAEEGDGSEYDSNFYHTPNLQLLRHEGMRFTNAYAQPICAPSRYSLFTGKYPATLKCTQFPSRPVRKWGGRNINIGAEFSRQQLPLNEITIAEGLKSQNYTSAHIGKWGVAGTVLQGNPCYPFLIPAFPGARSYSPSAAGMGFDFGIPDMFHIRVPVHYEVDHDDIVKNPDMACTGNSNNGTDDIGGYDLIWGGMAGDVRTNDPALFSDTLWGDPVPSDPIEYLTDSFTQKALDFIDEVTDPNSPHYNKPFLQYVSLFAPHWSVSKNGTFPAKQENIDFFKEKSNLLNLVAHWRLDEGFYGDRFFKELAYDSASANGYDGTLHGSSKDKPMKWLPLSGQQNTQGKIKGALRFNGTNDYIEIEGYKGITGLTSRTVSAWIKTNPDGNQHIVTWGKAVAGEMWLLTVNQANNALRVAVFDGYIIGSTNIADGQWHHVAAVFDNTISQDVKDVKLYVDGQLDTISSFLPRLIDTAVGNKVKIGVFTGGSSFFNGLIDDVRIYDRALDLLEIEELAMLYCDPIVGGLNLVGYWPFDENDPGNHAGKGKEGTLVNGPVWKPTLGHFNGALQFDGTNDYIEIEGYKGITGSASRTVSAWIKTSPDGNQHIVTWGTAVAGEMWHLSINQANNALRIAVLDGHIIGSTNIADGQWHHVAAVLSDDGSPDVNEIKLYVDGDPDPESLSLSRQIDTAVGNNVKIGVFTTGAYFNGFIDDVRIYDAPLSAGDVQNWYDYGTEPSQVPVAHWTLDEHSRDNSGNKRHGELLGFACGPATGDVWSFTTGLDPLGDEDGDGMPNGWEVDNGLNPLLDDAGGDLDADGMPNLWEYQYDLNPNDSSDADGHLDTDGFSNVVEFIHGSDPTSNSSVPQPTTISIPTDVATIQQAIDWSIDGDVIVLDAVTYTGSGNRDLNFGGKAITIRSIDPSDPAVVANTVIDCEGTLSDPHRGFTFMTSEG